MRYYNIAEIKISIDGIDESFEENFCSKLKEYEVPRFNEPDMNIKYFDNCKNFSLISSSAKEQVCINGRHWCETNDGYLIYDTAPDTNETVLYINADKCWHNIEIAFEQFERFKGASSDIRLFNTMIDVMRQSILHHNGIIIHSSALKYTDAAGKDHGLIFSAPSGTGKSTHTKLWQDSYGSRVKIVNDDTPILKFDNEKVLLCGMPWSGSTGINSNNIVPLDAIIFIERGISNSIRKMSSIEKIHRLLSETNKSIFKANMTLTLDAVEKLIKTVDIYLLSCTISTDAVDVVKNELGLV